MPITYLAKHGVRRVWRAVRHGRPLASSSPSPEPSLKRHLHDDMEAPFPDLYLRCVPFTMTSAERLYALFQAVQHVERHGVEGDVVECGVWRGGSSMMAALTLLHSGNCNRRLHLYDTFQGMPAPGRWDEKFDGSVDAAGKYQSARQGSATDWCLAALPEVKQNLADTGYPEDQVRFVPGKVEDTLPERAPERPIAILRLDTDFYESTRCELEHLYPKLVPGGILIIDDYGAWRGAHKATEDYFAALPARPLLHKIDRTGRMAEKPSLA